MSPGDVMYNIVTTNNNTVLYTYLKVAKKVDLKSSCKEKSCNHVWCDGC